MQYIESTPSNSFYLAPVTQTQVFTLFAGLKENKASLIVPNKLIKLATEQLSAPFTEIYNESILSGEFPEFFKISKVTPIFKSGSLSDLGNYRPTEVISPFSKVLERLVYDQLVSYLEKECLLFNFQFGFRKGYSTEYAILETVEKLKSAVDDQKITCAANMLSINFKKTNYMIITPPKKKTYIRITACNIEQKSQIKYLGVFIDEHLKWDAQLQHINNKITKNIGILFKLRHYVPVSTLKQLYYTLIYPYLTYGLMS